MTVTAMQRGRWTAIAAVLLTLGVGAGYWWGHRASAMSPVPAASDSAMHERRVLYWHDPMAPSARFDKPGKSPFMDMQLEPVYADAANDSNAVRVSPSAMQNLGIRLGRVEMAPLSTRLRAVGSVGFDERLLELVQSRVEGYVTRLDVKTPLEHVRKGQPLATILAPQWIEAEQEYLALLDAHSERAQVIRDAARQRLVVLGVPAATIRAVETKRETNASTTVYAPIDGAVTELGVREGATFMAGTSLFRINGLASVWVSAQIPEASVSRVPLNSMVEATATAWPGMTFKGRVIALLPQVDPQTRTLTARVALDNRDGKIGRASCRERV